MEAKDGEFRVYLRPGLNEQDSRALLAHEVAHVLLSRDQKLCEIVRQQKLGHDPDVESLVDWLAYSLLIPRELIDAENSDKLFEGGFTLASRWRVPPKIAFTRLLKFIGAPGDLMFSVSVEGSSKQQIASWKIKKCAE